MASKGIVERAETCRIGLRVPWPISSFGVVLSKAGNESSLHGLLTGELSTEY